jgi:hypothetical protein
MIEQKLLKNVRFRIKNLWSISIFRYTIIIHSVYFVISTILTLIFFQNQNDFLVYYRTGEIALQDFSEIYNPTNVWPFRYLPLAAFYFIPFYLIGFELGFIIFNLINLILNILISVYLYKIIVYINRGNSKENEKRIIFYICIFLLSLPQVFNYILGQINLYIAFFLVFSLFLFLKYKQMKIQFLAGLILGISMIFKPITILIIPFIILCHYDFDKKKFKIELSYSIIRFIAAIIPLIINIVIFLINRKLLHGFISINITGESNTLVNYSFSITKLVTNFLFFNGFSEIMIIDNQFMIFIIILFIVLLIGLFIFIFRRNSRNPLIYGYILAILIMLLTYFDSWDHHLLNLLPLLIIAIFNGSQGSKVNKKYIKPSFFFLCFLDIAFMGLYILMNPNINSMFFPFNFVPTLFLCYLFYGIAKYSIIKPNTE